jgi:crossover junction endodeoxyribonuclease RuvC
MIIFALDVASVTGWARGAIGEVPRCGSVRFASEGASHLAICGRAMEWAIDTLGPAPRPDVVAIEALLPPMVIRRKSNVDHDLLAELQGVMLGVCFLRGIYKVNRFAVGKVRAHFIDLSVCAKGEAKLHVIRKCRSLGWLETADDDAADACALWSYQCSLIDPQQSLRVSPLFNRKLSA